MADTHTRSDILTHRTFTVVTWILSIFFNVKYVVGRHHIGNGKFFDVSNTPFTANVFFILGYFGFMYLLQFAFLTQFYSKNSTTLRHVSELGWHFSLFNVLSIIWAYDFAHGHYTWALIILIINFINLLTNYVSHRPYALKPVSTYILVHVPTTAMPLAWVFFGLFWNGAVVAHAKGFAARLLANIFIWDFLLTPAAFLILYKDWATGLSFAYITAALAVGQLFTKVIALQWIFATIIAGLTLLFSLVVAFPSIIGNELEATLDRNAENEHAPLLS